MGVASGKIASALLPHGLILRGGFDFDEGEDRPAGPSGARARSVVLVGSAGAGWWPEVRRWLDSQPGAHREPLDTWSREIVGRIAAQAGARLVMPNDRPYAPFQQWAMRAEGLKPSPIGLLMHPDYGLWHAYRAGLLFDEPLSAEMPGAADGPVHFRDACAAKPCLKACPVQAHSQQGFVHRDCLDHVRGPNGAPCRDSGCLDRNACPVGTDWRYPAEVQAFLQRAFAGLS